jgi:type I restriction enzyme S subunit
MASVKDLTPFGIRLDSCRRIADEDFEKLVRQGCQPLKGDVLIAKDGATALDTVCEVKRNEDVVLLSSVAILRPNPAIIDSSYLHYYLDASETRSYLKSSFISGAAIPRVVLKDLKRAAIRVPSLPAQQHIASILSAYDELIENSQRRIKILEATAHALYREWFVHFRFPGHKLCPRVSCPLGDIPNSWKVKKLGEIATITMGLSPKGDTYNEDAIGTPLVNGPVEFGERFAKAVKWTTAPTKLCSKGDLIVCVRGSTTGKYVKSDATYCLGRGVCSISYKYQSFIDHLFENELPALLGQVGGSTFPSWTGPQLYGHNVICPSEDVLETFESLVGPMTENVFMLSKKIDNLRRTRDLLLPRLLSGQIDVATLAA